MYNDVEKKGKTKQIKKKKQKIVRISRTENRMVNMEFQLNGMQCITLSNELPMWL